MTVESDLCEVSEALFLKMHYLKLESLRLSFTLGKPSLRDSSLTRGIYVELEFLRLEFHVNATWIFAT